MTPISSSSDDRIKFILDLCQQGGESEVVEFKEAKRDYSFEKLGKYFSALCNEANLQGVDRSWIIFGVKDEEKEIIGTEYRLDEDSLMSLKEEVARHTTGHLTFTRISVETIHSHRVILFEIPAAPQGMPIAWKDHYYGRDHEALGGLHINEIETIRGQVSQVDWSAKISQEATLDDLDEEAIAIARQEYAKKHPRLAEEMKHWDAVTFLNKAKLTIKGKITHAALLLLGTPESSHLIAPALAQISWILKDKDGVEKDYEHFHAPLLLAVDRVFYKVRQLRYRYMLSGDLFPEEVDQYEPYLIREALHNAIAHQDYLLGGRVILVENESDSLIFVNRGSFLPESVEAVIQSDAPSSKYRNNFLVTAMVNLNLIDTIGSGIKKMFLLQKKKFFPLPDYRLTKDQVTVEIIGKVLDVNYANKLAHMPDLGLQDIMLLDKVQKNDALTTEDIKYLRGKKLIEGRKPNLHISSGVAAQTNQAVDYMKQRGADKEFCEKTILESLSKFGEMDRKQFEDILLSKLSETLAESQKKNRIKNILQDLKKQGKIEICSDKKHWKLAVKK